MKSNPDISIIIANFNKSSFIDRAIRSCLNQIAFRKQIEIIVIDDCSTDNSIEIIEEFSSDIIFIKNERNMGIGYTSQVGIDNASGKYWMRVDADDFISEHTCEFLSKLLEYNNEYDYVYSDHFRVDMRGRKIDRISLAKKEVLYMHGAGIMFKTDVLKEIGGYDTALRNCEDYDLLLRLDKFKKIGYHLPIPLYRYYIHGNNITLDPERLILKKMVEDRYGI